MVTIKLKWMNKTLAIVTVDTFRKESKIEYMNTFDPTMKLKEDVKKEAKDVSKEQVNMSIDDFNFGDSMNFGN